MAFRQDQKNSQKQKVSQSSQLIEAITSNEKSDIELQDELDLAISTDADLEEEPSELGDDVKNEEKDDQGDDENAPDVDEDGRLNEDIDWDTYIPKDDTNRIEQEIRQRGLPPPDCVSSEITYNLQSHLMSQLLLSKLNVVQKEIGVQIISNLDEKGYLENPIEELWREKQRYKLETWLETLRLIQKFDPKGVAARDLQECLLIQARSKKVINSLVEKIINYHWDDFLYRKCDAIAKNLSVPVYDVHAAISVVSGFDPRPGQRYNKKIYFKKQLSIFNDSAFHIKPDFWVYKDGNDYKIEPEHFYIDPIISDYFYKKFESGALSPQSDNNEYLKKLRNFKRLYITLYNRHKNIYLTIKCIVRLQKDFFDSGSLMSLKPLIARDVAEKIKLDESTVRRIRKNKYVDTPHGIFKLEFFFDRVGVDTQDGRKIASVGVKEQIKKIIESENKQKPYSDQKIAEKLREVHNLKIESRTIGNYRKKLGLLSAKFRKWPC